MHWAFTAETWLAVSVNLNDFAATNRGRESRVAARRQISPVASNIQLMSALPSCSSQSAGAWLASPPKSQ